MWRQPHFVIDGIRGSTADPPDTESGCRTWKTFGPLNAMTGRSSRWWALVNVYRYTTCNTSTFSLWCAEQSAVYPQETKFPGFFFVPCSDIRFNDWPSCWLMLSFHKSAPVAAQAVKRNATQITTKYCSASASAFGEKHFATEPRQRKLAAIKSGYANDLGSHGRSDQTEASAIYGTVTVRYLYWATGRYSDGASQNKSACSPVMSVYRLKFSAKWVCRSQQL